MLCTAVQSTRESLGAEVGALGALLGNGAVEAGQKVCERGRHRLHEPRLGQEGQLAQRPPAQTLALPAAVSVDLRWTMSDLAMASSCRLGRLESVSANLGCIYFETSLLACESTV